MQLIETHLGHFNFFCPATGQQVLGDDLFEPSPATVGVWIDEMVEEPSTSATQCSLPGTYLAGLDEDEDWVDLPVFLRGVEEPNWVTFAITTSGMACRPRELSGYVRHRHGPRPARRGKRRSVIDHPTSKGRGMARLIPKISIDEITLKPERDVAPAPGEKLPNDSIVYHSYPWLRPERNDREHQDLPEGGRGRLRHRHPSHGRAASPEVKGGRIETSPTTACGVRILDTPGRMEDHHRPLRSRAARASNI